MIVNATRGASLPKSAGGSVSPGLAVRLGRLRRVAQDTIFGPHLWLMGLCLIIGGARAGKAQDTPELRRDLPWQIQYFTEDAGLSSKYVFDLAFETNGITWLATSDGLYRYDGYLWNRFAVEDGLPTNRVRSVCVTRRGEIWVGTERWAGVFDPSTKRFDARNSPTGLAGPNVRRIVEDADGALWFCCDRWPDPEIQGGLTVLKDGQWQSYGVREGLPHDHVLNWFRDSQGRMFALTFQGLAQWNQGRWEKIRHPLLDQSGQMWGICEYPAGCLWVRTDTGIVREQDGTWNLTPNIYNFPFCLTRQGDLISLKGDVGLRQLTMQNGRSGQVESYPIAWQMGQIEECKQAPDGSLWIVGQELVVRWEYAGGEWMPYKVLPPPILVDGRQQVWFANGDESWVKTGAEFRRFTIKDPLFPAAGRGIWSSMDQELVRCDGERQERFPARLTGLVQCDNVVIDPQGWTWFAGQGLDASAVLACYDGNQWTQPLKVQLQNRTVESMIADPRQGLWVVLRQNQRSSYQLLHVLGGKAPEGPHNRSKPTLTDIRLLADESGLWLYNSRTIYRFDTAPESRWWRATNALGIGFWGAFVLGDNAVFCSDGLGSGLGGLSVFHQGQWSQAAVDVLPQVQALVPDQSVLTGNRGFYLIQPQPLNLRYVPVPGRAGLTRALQAPDRTCWVHTLDGVFSYQPRGQPPGIRFEQTMDSVRQDATLVAKVQGLTAFHPKNWPAEFDHSWRLDQEPWKPFQKNNEIRAAVRHLAPGPHRLEVRARDCFDRASPTGAQMWFRVSAIPLQERALFWPVVGGWFALLVGLLALAWNRAQQTARTNQGLRSEATARQQAQQELERARLELEQRVNERTQELKQTVDHLSREIAERQLAEKNQSRLEEQLRHVHKMEAIGTLAGGIAHDFNNILAAIIPYAHLAKEDVPNNPAVHDSLNEILRAANRAKGLVQQILTFSRQGRQERKTISLAPIIQEAIKLLRPILPATIEIVADIQEPPRKVLADPNQIHQVLVNLCTNAAYAIGSKPGRIEIILAPFEVRAEDIPAHSERSPGSCVRLTVADTGCGMDDQTMKRVFEPFFTTKPAGQGTGLGLSVVHGIVRDHNGAITLSSQPGRGTTVQVDFPTQTDEHASPEKPPEFPISGHGEHILLVDDEESLVQVFSRVLKRAGYQVTTQRDPIQALAWFRQQSANCHLVITDLTMPRMTGVDFAVQLLQVRQNVPILLATGFVGAWTDEAVRRLGLRGLVHKPLDPQALVRQVQEILLSPATPTIP
jgi:signal transduction histidine kinase/ligand-binding sensor domain-containing protein/ActR/RegA family two-component response regulator